MPISVAHSAATTPTAIETCEPLIALSSTSRPQRSPPHGSVIERSGSVLFSSAVRLAHSSYLGASGASRMFIHILPNVSHVILVQLSLLVVSFIKVEVILSFLGLGVPVDMVSWGTMLSEAQTELVIGKWWQLAAATVFMAIFLTAFSMLTDSLRDALDPKLR